MMTLFDGFVGVPVRYRAWSIGILFVFCRRASCGPENFANVTSAT
jgi:hypothetical protein